tara:strand:+ start:517 stop:813 length:297 start_codon:yes stop_codon:yes gene_type:complete
MPWHIESNNAECQGFAVVKDDDLQVIGCHRTETQALRQIAALYAAEEDMEDDDDDVEDDDMADRADKDQQLKDTEQKETHGKRRKEVEKILADLRAVR